jgi:hypothetical protein
MRKMSDVLIAVSQHTVFLAELSIAGCAACTPTASLPLAYILDRLSNHPPGQVDYILPVLASCPRCRAALNELTLVVPKNEGSRASGAKAK